LSQQDTSVTVLLAAPLEFTRIGVEAGKQALAKSIEVIVNENWIGKFRLQVLGFPDFIRLEAR